MEFIFEYTKEKLENNIRDRKLKKFIWNKNLSNQNEKLSGPL